MLQTNVISYRWDFGNDGGILTTRMVEFTPKTLGIKKICVTVTVFGGISETKCFETLIYKGDSSKTQLYELSAEEEKIQGVNIGRLVFIDSQIWMTRDVLTFSTASNTIPNQCPSHFRFIYLLK